MFFKGFGNFGNVYEGTWTNRENIVKKVAIKEFKQKNTVTDMINEILTGASLNHENLVEFLGISLESNSIILELMEGGQLLSFLRLNDGKLTQREQLGFCFDMHYLRQTFLSSSGCNPCPPLVVQNYQLRTAYLSCVYVI